MVAFAKNQPADNFALASGGFRRAPKIRLFGRRIQMKGKQKGFGIIAAAALIGLSMTGCATNASMISPGWDQQLMLPDGKHVRDYTILGVVQVEERRTVILGSFLPAIPVPGGGGGTLGGNSIHLIRATRGRATYAALLAEARRQFPNANAVIGVQIDRVDSSFLFFFGASRTYILTGLAVEFAEAPPPRREQIASLD